MGELKQPSREQVAIIEVGHTAVSPALARCLVVVFLLLIFTVPLVQQVVELRSGAVPQCYDILRQLPSALSPLRHGDVFEANRRLMKEMRAYEDDLENESVFGERIRPWVQYGLARWLGGGSEKAYVGREAWLFYRPEIDYLTGPGFLDAAWLAKRAASGTEWRQAPKPDPRKAIVDFKDQLAKRGITLVVVPTPVKPMIQPGQFSRAYADRESPLQNRSYAQFIRELEGEGVLVFDVSEALVQARIETGNPQYLATDTHWRPEAAGRTAKLLREFVANHCPLPPAPAAGYDASPVTVTNRGDIAIMLKLPACETAYPPENVVIRQVATPRREMWSSSPSADVLVLGDSFCNIYSMGAMGWGESAGFVEQLGLGFQRPLDRIVVNDNGSYATRAALARELARGRDRLAGKKLVIWQFADRELTEGDWKLIELKLGQPPPTRFVVPAAGAEQKVRGIVASVSGVPRPGTVPYKDHVVSIHLVDVTGGSVSNGQAVVYMMSMRDNAWTAAAQYRPGDEVELKLKPWFDVSAEYEGINRSELDDSDLQLQEPCWGEIL
jgi:alginate O-acetyltransferase complex protein AlgJ